MGRPSFKIVSLIPKSWVDYCFPIVNLEISFWAAHRFKLVSLIPRSWVNHCFRIVKSNGHFWVAHCLKIVSLIPRSEGAHCSTFPIVHLTMSLWAAHRSRL